MHSFLQSEEGLIFAFPEMICLAVGTMVIASMAALVFGKGTGLWVEIGGTLLIVLLGYLGHRSSIINEQQADPLNQGEPDPNNNLSDPPLPGPRSRNSLLAKREVVV